MPAACRAQSTTLGNTAASANQKRHEAKTGATTWLRIAKPGDATGGIVRDVLGRVTSREELMAPMAALPSTAVRWDYTYDDRGRLKTAVQSGGATASYTYAYDENGNRTSVNGFAATYDNQDRLLSYGGVAYTYTNNGALKSRGGTELFDYDLSGNLRKRSVNNVEYLIDGKNRRVAKKKNGVFEAAWLYDDQLRIAAQLTGAGQVRQVFAYGVKPNVPELVYQPTPVAGFPNGKVYRIISDLNGSVRAVVDISVTPAVMVQRIDYLPSGRRASMEAIVTTGGYEPIPFGYAGGLHDADTGLVRFGARDYDPETGRWVSKDPARFGGGVNLYAYCYGDPINFVDPGGDIADILVTGSAAGAPQAAQHKRFPSLESTSWSLACSPTISRPWRGNGTQTRSSVGDRSTPTGMSRRSTPTAKAKGRVTSPPTRYGTSSETLDTQTVR
ncbi:MAG: RHS repeat-associated core domain-containing protein [Myxococcales bacterium]|nr:RHS repeat-associated core domain-containing protein [Myxococcales bacterium]